MDDRAVRPGGPKTCLDELRLPVVALLVVEGGVSARRVLNCVIHVAHHLRRKSRQRRGVRERQIQAARMGCGRGGWERRGKRRGER